MKKFLYFLAGLLAFSATSCKDDDVIDFTPDNDLDRMPMTMFRKNHNTNQSNNESYASKLVEGSRNAVQLYWYGVEGAGGYEVRYGIATPLTSGTEEAWSNPDNLAGTYILPPDVLHFVIPDLNYSSDYRFSIRVLHPDYVKTGPDGKLEVIESEKHSKWYGRGNGQQWEDYLGIGTSARYATPNVIFASDKDFHSFNIYVDLADKTASLPQADRDTIAVRFDTDANGNFVAHKIYVFPDAVNPEAQVPDEFRNGYPIDPEMLKLNGGVIRVEGLDENSNYVVRIQNENRIFVNSEGRTIDVDSYYNDATIRTKGTPGQPITIYHKITDKIYNDSTWNVGEREYNCMRIDTIITQFNSSPTLAEGQVFYLQGGKAYYFWNNTDINKGFTLETDPEDVKNGLRAKVYIGGIADTQGKTNDTRTCNFMFGKALGAGEVDAPVQVENVIFRNIDFSVPKFQVYADRGSDGNGNYFANMYSNGRGISFEKLELDGCTFQGFVRGFIRTQGTKAKQFKHIIINNCVFQNNGYFRTNNGGGYSLVHGDQSSVENNIFTDLQITNNTFYDCQNVGLITQGNNSQDWGPDLHYKITVNNNTFINFGTRAGSLLFNFRYFPGGSYVSYQNNLFVLAADEKDERELKFIGADLRTINGSGTITLDIKNNYSVGCRDNHLKDNGIFSGNLFSATKNSFGSYKEGLVSGDANDLFVKVGTTPLKATDLFMDPNPKHLQVKGQNHPMDHRSTSDIFERLRYKTDAKVTEHEIYRLNIGDQRWKLSDPKAAWLSNE